MGLYSNINAKRKRIKAGSNETHEEGGPQKVRQLKKTLNKPLKQLKNR